MTRGLWPWLRLLLAIGILVAVGLRLGADAFLDGIRAISLWSVFAALVIGLVTTVLSAGRWCVVARRLGLALPLGTAVSDYYRGLLLNAVLPAGVLGDVHRAVSHGHRAGDLGRGVRAVVFERFAGQVVLAVIACVVLFSQPALVDAMTGGFALNRGTLITVVALLAVAAVPAVLWRRRAVRALATVWADLRVGMLSGGALPLVVLLSAATVAGHVALFLVAARVAGSSATPAQLVPLAVSALLVMALPLNVGGWGPREAFLAIAFGATGLGAAQGLTTAVVYGVLALVAGLPGALVLLRVKDRQVRPERRHQPGEQVLAFAR